jgi:hypothetical protein
MKRMLLAISIAAAALVALTAGSARADSATRVPFSFSGTNSLPAGTLCDFNYEDTGTVVGAFTVLPDGEVLVQNVTQYVTHTNLDTGYSLSEVDHVADLVLPNSSTEIAVGIFWHLRDASGKTVLVKAGETSFNFVTGEITFTPNSGGDQTGAQIVCPALGGSPA